MCTGGFANAGHEHDELVALEQSRHLSAGQQRVHPLQERRVKDVGLVEDEAYSLSGTAGPLEQVTQVVVEVVKCVPPRRLHLCQRGGSNGVVSD